MSLAVSTGDLKFGATAAGGWRNGSLSQVSKGDVEFALKPRLWRKLAAIALLIAIGSTIQLWWFGVEGLPLLVLAATIVPTALTAAAAARSWLRECRTIGVPPSMVWLLRRAIDWGAHPVARVGHDGVQAPVRGGSGPQLHVQWDQITGLRLATDRNGSTMLCIDLATPAAFIESVESSARPQLEELSRQLGTPVAINVSLLWHRPLDELLVALRQVSNDRLRVELPASAS